MQDTSNNPNPAPIRLDGRVALVTGAWRRLGRAYAAETTDRRAAIPVSDPGLRFSGDGGGDHGPPDEIVARIAAAGGKALADYGSVSSETDANGMSDFANPMTYCHALMAVCVTFDHV